VVSLADREGNMLIINFSLGGQVRSMLHYVTNENTVALKQFNNDSVSAGSKLLTEVLNSDYFMQSFIVLSARALAEIC
jgi:hypothetical protein